MSEQFGFSQPGLEITPPSVGNGQETPTVELSSMDYHGFTSEEFGLRLSQDEAGVKRKQTDDNTQSDVDDVGERKRLKKTNVESASTAPSASSLDDPPSTPLTASASSLPNPTASAALAISASSNMNQSLKRSKLLKWKQPVKSERRV